MAIEPGYIERQNARMALMAKRQIEYSEQRQQERNNMAKRPRAAKQSSQAEGLLEALKFVSVATQNETHIGVTAKHVRLKDGMAVAWDMQLAAGYPVAEEVNNCPQIEDLINAISRSGKSLVISETPGGKLSVKGEKLRANVPCLEQEFVPVVLPDPNIAPVDERIKVAFKACGTLATEQADRVIEASLWLRGGDCTGTNGKVILQFWHGNDLPPQGMVLPKVFCAAVAACKIPLAGFGCSWFGNTVSSVTFWFENGAWLKTQCYDDGWPSIEHLWLAANYQPVPEGFFEAIDAVSKFNAAGFVSLVENAVASHKNIEIGASYKVPGLQPGKGFTAEFMAKIAPWCNSIDLTTYNDRAFFMGGDAETPVRGIVMTVVETVEDSGDRKPAVEIEPKPQPEAPASTWESPAPGWSSADGVEIDDDVELP